MGVKWAEDAQKDEMGQGSPKAMKWVKKARSSMNVSLMTILLAHYN